MTTTKLKVLCLAGASLVGAIAAGNADAAERGEKTFGVRTGYVSRNRSMDAGLFFQYTFSNHLRIQPGADIVFRHRDRDAFTIDLDFQVPFNFSTSNFDLYPYAGLNFSSWNTHIKDFTTVDGIVVDPDRFSDDVSSRKNRFGLNLGAGFDLKLSSTLKLNLQAGYTFVKSNSGLRILAGIGYVF